MIIVAGAGGFIGGHLVRGLIASDIPVRAVDVKPLSSWYQVHSEAENVVADLQLLDACLMSTEGADQVFNLAADMGGMGFIENNKAACMLSSLINTHLLIAARDTGLTVLLLVISVRLRRRQADRSRHHRARGGDAYPAEPEDGYGWEKLFGERMGRHFMEDFGLEFRTARYHNVYGPYGTWDGGARRPLPPSAERSSSQADRRPRDRGMGRWAPVSVVHVHR